MNDQATRSLIGRTVGGSPDTLDELSSWIGDTLQPLVDQTGDKLNDLIEELPEIWFDRNSAQFLAMLRQGRNDTNKLADRLKDVADLIGDTGPAIRKAQARLDDVIEEAAGLGLEVTEEGVWSYYDISEWQPYDVDIVAEWHELCSKADAALEPLATQMETMAGSNIWPSVLFTSGAFVNATTEKLLGEYEKTHGSLLDGGPERSAGRIFGFQRLGILKLVVRGGGPLIDGLQAANSLREGKRPDRVLVEYGVGSLVGGASAALGAGAVSALVAGSIAVPVLFGVGAVVLLGLAVYLPEEVGDVYIRNAPLSVAARLRESGAVERYDDDGRIQWDKGEYEY